MRFTPPPNSIILSFDTKAKIAIKEYKGSIYTKNKHVYYPAKQKVRGLLEMPAAINIHTGDILYWFYDWKNSFIIIECFEDILKKYPDSEIYIILDNWSAHTSYVIKVWAFFHPRIHLVFLPTNASWMNMIERVFAKFDKDILQNSNFQSVKEAITKISNYFQNELSFKSWST
ncbi:MAG: IS630 family transposase [Candidatus Nanoarchaeia archaeon]